MLKTGQLIRSMPVVAILFAGCAMAPVSAPRGDILIDGKNVHPESVTSTSKGVLITGSMSGTLYRASSGENVARAFVIPDAQNGLRSVFGVLADEKSGRLWVCSVPNSFAPRIAGAAPPAPSEVAAFELDSGKLIGRWPFPAPGGNALEVAVSDERLKGIDGLDFGADGALYVNNVQKNELWRVSLPVPGKAAQLTLLKASQSMGGPDGLRHIGGNRFLQAEGASGRATLVTVKQDEAQIQVLRDGLDSSPGITLIGDTVYVVEGKIQYMFNPDLRGKDPGPFKAIAIPLPKP